MEIKINIINNGDAVGTIGWLARNAATIKIGATKQGKQAAWLLDREGKTITVLAVRDYYDCGGIDRATNARIDAIELVSDISFTDAAWGIIEDLIQIAVDAMESTEKEAASKVSVRIA